MSKSLSNTSCLVHYYINPRSARASHSNARVGYLVIDSLFSLQLLNSTLVPGATMFLDQYGDFRRLVSAQGTDLFVIKQDDQSELVLLEYDKKT